MSTRKEFEKVKADNPSRRDMPRSHPSKSIPREASAGEPGPKGSLGSPGHWNEGSPLHANDKYKTKGNWNGDNHNFNIKGKIVNNAGSDYHDYQRPDSGLHGNFAEKDASMAYLRDRNKQGIEVRHYAGTNKEAKLTIGHGPTAFDTRPIPETYKSATSQGSVDPNAVVYKTASKARNVPQASSYLQDTESDKTMKPIAKHLKGKE